VGDYVRLLATAAMAYHAEERNTRILLQVFVADDIIVQEVLQNNKSQRTAESEKESSRIDHLPVWRHRAAADHHRLVDNTLLDDVRCNSDAGLCPLFQQVVVYIVAEVVPPLDLDQLAFIPRQRTEERRVGKECESTL